MHTLGRRSGPIDTPAGERPVADVDERDLVRRCRAGDRAAHDEFYRRYRRQVASVLYRVLNERRELEDLVQEVFLIAFRGLERFRGDARVSTWLYRICVNVALGAIRANARRPQPVLVGDPDEPPADGTAAHDGSPLRCLERRRARARVLRLLAALPPKKRVVLYLHEIEGLEPKEIADIVGAHPVTVRTRLFYARREFFRLAAQEAEEA
ncbi:MAG: sigma-70 family RNA polymerase sigma factor [Deltaproteobacteria bacterium]|nr:MAG: sigma-70 family RNA polymerase sigma factor [Deltaproteobacteria bacterium]